MAPQTFKKSERLVKKKLIKELFKKGSSFYLYPFKVLSLNQHKVDNIQVLISVPKRSHKSAPTRNKIKRRFREAYRLNKHLLNAENKLVIAYIYTAKEILDYKQIEIAVTTSLKRLNSIYQSKNNEEV